MMNSALSERNNRSARYALALLPAVLIAAGFAFRGGTYVADDQREEETNT
jgi:hypothetical protein